MRNQSSGWLTGPLKEIYDNTEGPCGSPDEFECWLLYSLAHQSNGIVLEIGTWRGRSACFLGFGLVCRGKAGFLTCIDWFQGDNTGGDGASHEKAVRALSKFDLSSEIINQDMRTVDWSIHAQGAGLVFYDASHLADDVEKVLRDIHPHIAPDCKVVIHDAFFDGSKVAIDRLQDIYQISLKINIWEGLVVLIKQ